MITIDDQKQKPSGSHSHEIPRLRNGDRMTRAEFERRYAAMPETVKAELIEEIVYMPSPVNHKSHGEPHSHMNGCLFVFCAATPGLEISDNATVRLDLDNEPQPDVLLRIQEEAGGASSVDADGYVQGAPELVVEVAHSSAAYDMHAKLNAYRRNGVQEYVVWLVEDKEIQWFTLEEGQYQPLVADQEGVISSQVFPGLRLNVQALLANKLDVALETVQAGIGSEEHQAFMQQLAGGAS